MGCGTSRGIEVEAMAGRKSSLDKSDHMNDQTSDHAFYHDQLLQDKSLELFNPHGVESLRSKSELSDFEKSSVFQRPCSVAGEGGDCGQNGQRTPNGQNIRKASSETNLQERIQVLKNRRRLKSESQIDSEVNGVIATNGTANGSPIPNGCMEYCNYSPSQDTHDPSLLRNKYDTFDTEGDDLGMKSSPFGQRSRLKMTDSQREFFSMLDEKIAQGRDYCSEDEKSISSLVSRRSTRGFPSRRLLTPLRLQHAR